MRAQSKEAVLRRQEKRNGSRNVWSRVRKTLKPGHSLTVAALLPAQQSRDREGAGFMRDWDCSTAVFRATRKRRICASVQPCLQKSALLR